MGTNYYLHTNVCPYCGRGEERLHIGKQSIGWAFIFQATPEIRNTEQWRRLTADPKNAIIDEYGDRITYTAFWGQVAVTKGMQHHTQFFHSDDYVDEEGNDFFTGEFS